MQTLNHFVTDGSLALWFPGLIRTKFRVHPAYPGSLICISLIHSCKRGLPPKFLCRKVREDHYVAIPERCLPVSDGPDRRYVPVLDRMTVRLRGSVSKRRKWRTPCWSWIGTTNEHRSIGRARWLARTELTGANQSGAKSVDRIAPRNVESQIDHLQLTPILKRLPFTWYIWLKAHLDA